MTTSSRITAVAGLVGLTVGMVTLNMSTIVAVKDTPIRGLLAKSIIPILIPGLIASLFTDSMWIGCIVNAIFYFGLAWVAGSLWHRIHSKPQAVDPPSADPLG